MYVFIEQNEEGMYLEAEKHVFKSIVVNVVFC